MLSSIKNNAFKWALLGALVITPFFTPTLQAEPELKTNDEIAGVSVSIGGGRPYGHYYRHRPYRHGGYYYGPPRRYYRHHYYGPRYYYYDDYHYGPRRGGIRFRVK